MVTDATLKHIHYLFVVVVLAVNICLNINKMSHRKSIFLMLFRIKLGKLDKIGTSKLPLYDNYLSFFIFITTTQKCVCNRYAINTAVNMGP